MRLRPVSAPTAVITLVCALLSAAPAHSRPYLASEIARAPAGAASDSKTETRPIPEACRGVSLYTSDKVIVRQGSPAALSISGPADEVARTETVIEKGSLTIRKTKDNNRNYSYRNAQPVVVTVTLPTIESLSVNSSGDLMTEGTLKGADLTVSLAGSGDLHATVEMSGTVNSHLAGSGDMQLNGRCEKHTVRLAGSGDVKADQLAAQDVSAKLNGSGDIRVATVKSLDASVSGSGSVRYAGNPTTLVKRVTGSGSVAKQ